MNLERRLNLETMNESYASEAAHSATVAYSVVETTDAAASLARAADILPEMRAVKTADPSVDAVLLAVVDIVNLTSTLLVCGRVEASLAIAAYGGELEGEEGELLKLPGLVSRKKDFVPALTKAVKEGWAPPAFVVEEHQSQDLKRSRSMSNVAKGKIVVDYTDEPSGKIIRRGE